MEGAQASKREPTILEVVMSDIRGMTTTAEIIGMRVSRQRHRILGDLPPTPAPVDPAPRVEKSLDAPISAMELGEALQILRSRLVDIDNHTSALQKVG